MTGAIAEVLIERVSDRVLVVVEERKGAIQAIDARLGADEAFRYEGLSLSLQQGFLHDRIIGALPLSGSF